MRPSFIQYIGFSVKMLKQYMPKDPKDRTLLKSDASLAVRTLQAEGSLGSEGTMVICSGLHKDGRYTARVFAPGNGPYLGGVHLYPDGCKPPTFQRQEKDAKYSRWRKMTLSDAERRYGLEDVCATAVLSRLQMTDIRCHELQLLVDDARRCLQMNFESIQKHCFEIYHSALAWIPNESLIRKVYATDVSRAPKLTLGLSNSWDPTEIVMQNSSGVNSVAFSQDGSRIISGSDDETVIWNATTGEVQAELKGHRVQDELQGLRAEVASVAFSRDGSQVVSGSYVKTVRIWNAMTGEMAAESSLDSGSYDKTVRIWNAMTSEVQAELKGHMDVVNSVAFSQDGSRVVSGSYDATVRIWNVTTGEVQAELKGHTSWVMSVAFSQDGSRVVSGSADDTVRIWNATTGEVQAELKGHTGLVRSVAFSQDGSRVVSGSYDETVRIWNVTTGEVHVMTTLSVKLPDSSEVHRAGTGKFFIVYPVQPMLSIDPTLSISDDGHWIVGALRDCWIPSHYCDFTSSSFSRDRACFGYSSGRVVILDVSVAL
ncbi:quinon protein alcohol dehydrogenase-like superfamily [Flammula alnicola]|nr:quinon protein alcohol dehydrogenase-like superfamily [Flammula alnicola]